MTTPASGTEKDILTDTTNNPDASAANDLHDLVLTSETRRGVYECDYCHVDISQLPRIRCAVCLDFDLCVDCFATTNHSAATKRLQALQQQNNTATATVMTHDDTHGYRVCDSTRYPLFLPRWNSTTAATAAVSSNSSATAADNNVPESAGLIADENVNAIIEADGKEPELGADNNAAKDTNEPVSSNEASVDSASDVMAATRSAVTAISEDTSNTVVVWNDSSNSAAKDPSIKYVYANSNNYNYWTIEEDLRLLQGIRTHGLGNWADVADAVAGQGSMGKTAKRCMERYLDGFLGRYGCILPPEALQVMGGEQVLANNETLEDVKKDQPVAESTYDLGDDGGEEKRSSKRRAVLLRSPSSVSNSNSATVTMLNVMPSNKRRFRPVTTESMTQFARMWPKPYLPSEDVVIGQEVGRDQAIRAEQLFVKTINSLQTPEEVEKIRQEWQERVGKPGGPTVLPMRVDDLPTLAGSQIVGFMPRRGDFDIEWENDAEQVIADMEFIPGEPAADRELKLKVLAIYNTKLDEREKRKQYVLSRELYDYHKNQLEEQKLPRDELDLVHRMRLFERFHTPEEHKIFIADLLKAKRLRKEIAKLQTYRRLGIRTLLEAEQYEVSKARRAFHTTASLQKEAEAAKLSEEKDGLTGGALAKAEEAASSSLWKQYRTNQRKDRNSLATNGPADAGETEATENKTSEVEASLQPVRTNDPMDTEELTSAEPTTNQAPTLALAPSLEEADALAVMPGLELLSAKEADLCGKLQLAPLQYQEIKRALIFESMSSGLLDNESLSSSKRALVKIDVQKRGQVIDFMVTAGWISLNLSETFMV